ncbi:hypothetical protein FA13DRAFT_1736732, partial [Coprinellus micaceus]
MPGPFRPIVNFVRRRRPKPADYSLLHVDPGLHPQEDRHDEQGSVSGTNEARQQGRHYNLKRISRRRGTRDAHPVEEDRGCGFVQGSSGLLLGTQRVLDVDHLPPPGSMLDDGREEGVEEVVRGTDARLGSVLRRSGRVRPPIPVWPAEDDSERLTVQSEAPRIPPMAGPPPRPPKSPQRLLHALQGRTMANPASSSSSGVVKPPTRRLKKRHVSKMPVPALVDNQTLVRRLSHLDLSLMPLEQHNVLSRSFTNGVGIESPSNVRVGERWDPEAPCAYARSIEGLDTTELFTPLSATAETPYTNLFDTPLSLASTLTDHECNSPPPREIISHDKDSGEAGVSERGALFLRESSRQDTESSLEESVVVPVTRLLLEVDSPQIRLLEGFASSSPVGDLIPLVNDAIDVDPHEDARGLGILGLDEVGRNLDATFERPIPRNRGSYLSIPSIASFPSIPSLPSTSSLASIPSIASSPSIDATTRTPANILGLSDESSSDDTFSPRDSRPRVEPSQHNTISFPRLPDMKVPDKPGWILQYVNGCYAPIPSSIPIEERKGLGWGKALTNLARGCLRMEDWDRLLEAFDADPYNWIANPPIMAFRRVTEATLINWVLSILYEIHSWIHGETETGTGAGMPPRFIQYLSYVGLAMHVSPSGLEILEIAPRDLRDISTNGPSS